MFDTTNSLLQTYQLFFRFLNQQFFISLPKFSFMKVVSKNEYSFMQELFPKQLCTLLFQEETRYNLHNPDSKKSRESCSTMKNQFKLWVKFIENGFYFHSIFHSPKLILFTTRQSIFEQKMRSWTYFYYIHFGG